MRIHNLQYTDQEDEASKIFITSLLYAFRTGSGMISTNEEQLQISDAPQRQNEPVLNHF